MALSWNWKDFWAWFESIELEWQIAVLLELKKEGWIGRLSAETQADVFEYAPLELLKQLKNLPSIKTEAIVIISKRLNKRNK